MEEIDELFFYYTGHGGFDGKEFYFMLSNYEKNKQKQTSFENSELDSLIKKLKPKITVKVIDACQSGVSYVKDSANLESYFKGSNPEFQKCYFFFSSQSNQSSYQDNVLSSFTKSFVESIANYPQETIRYKNIMDYISDSFKSPEQTPLFVVQADYSEVFANFSQESKDSLKLSIQNQPFKLPNIDDITGENNSLIDLIILESNDYCSIEEANDILEYLKEVVKNNKFEDILKDLYELEVSNNDSYSDIPNVSQIGRYFSQIKHNYFVRHLSHQEKIEEPSKYEGLDFYLPTTLKYLVPKKYKTIIDGVEPTTEMTYGYLEIKANRKYPSLINYSLIIVPFISKINLRLFDKIIVFKDKGWDEQIIGSSEEFNTVELKIKDKKGISDYINEKFDEFAKKIHKAINEKYNAQQTINTDDMKGEQNIIN